MLLATEWNASKRQPFRLLIVTISYKHTISYKQTKSKKLRPERSLYRVTTIPSTINVILTMRQKRAYLFTTIGPFLTVATLRTEIFFLLAADLRSCVGVDATSKHVSFFNDEKGCTNEENKPNHKPKIGYFNQWCKGYGYQSNDENGS